MKGRAFKRRRWLLAALAVVIFCAGVDFVAYKNFLVRAIPVYADDEQNFKYGSIGNDGGYRRAVRNMGCAAENFSGVLTWSGRLRVPWIPLGTRSYPIRRAGWIFARSGWRGADGNQLCLLSRHDLSSNAQRAARIRGGGSG